MDEETVRVTLEFKSRAAKDYFLAGLCDGWGEDHCDLYWPEGQELKTADALRVTVWHDMTALPFGGEWEEGASDAS